MKLKDIKKNHTFRFLFPLLYENENKDSDFTTNEFNGIYLGTDKYKDKLILIYTPNDTQSFYDLDNRLTSLNTFNADIDLKDGKIAYIFDILNDNINLFIEGKYSEFNNEYKQIIMKFWGLEENDPFHGILYKSKIGEQYYKDLSKKHRDNTAKNEYYPKPDMDKEYLKI